MSYIEEERKRDKVVICERRAFGLSRCGDYIR